MAPGIPRAEISTILVATRGAFSRPMMNLVQGGRVRRTGHKEACRYWRGHLWPPSEPALGFQP